MGDHGGVGVLPLQLQDPRGRELLVHVAGAVPQHHLAARDAVDVMAQVTVGAEDDLLLFRQAFDDLPRVGRGDHDVGHCLDRGRRVDVRDDRVARMRLDEPLERLRRAAVRQRAARVQVGHQHLLLRAEDLGRLAHEMHAAHDEDAGLRLRRPLRQGEAVAHEVGDVLDLARLVVVRQDDGVLLFPQPVDFRLEVDPGGNRRVHITYRISPHISLLFLIANGCLNRL